MEIQSLKPGRFYDFKIAGQPLSGEHRIPVRRSRNRFVGHKTINSASFLELSREDGSIALIPTDSIDGIAPVSAMEIAAMLLCLILAFVFFAGLARGLAEAGPAEPDWLTGASLASLVVILVVAPIMIHRDLKARAVTYKDCDTAGGRLDHAGAITQ